MESEERRKRIRRTDPFLDGNPVTLFGRPVVVDHDAPPTAAVRFGALDEYQVPVLTVWVSAFADELRV